MLSFNHSSTGTVSQPHIGFPFCNHPYPTWDANFPCWFVFSGIRVSGFVPHASVMAVGETSKKREEVQLGPSQSTFSFS